MSHKRSQQWQLSHAIQGFLQYKTIENLSPLTIIKYERHLCRFLAFTGDLPCMGLEPEHFAEFIVWLKTEYRFTTLSGKQIQPSNKTVYTYYTTLSVFANWLEEQGHGEKLLKGVPKPRYVDHSPEAFTQHDIESLLSACRYTRKIKRAHHQPYKARRSTYRRDTAIIYTLLDTGLRASEFCALYVSDLDMNTGEIVVRKGKGGKKRSVFVGKRTRKAIWHYLAQREYDDNDPLFAAIGNRRMSKDTLYVLMKRLAKRAGVKDCHPHRFRHTFAIFYLRSGGDLLTLQALLGHSSLEMVKRYAKIAKVDLETAHRRASPVDNLF